MRVLGRKNHSRPKIHYGSSRGYSWDPANPFSDKLPFEQKKKYPSQEKRPYSKRKKKYQDG